jgi:hypothetical protein
MPLFCFPISSLLKAKNLGDVVCLFLHQIKQAIYYCWRIFNSYPIVYGISNFFFSFEMDEYLRKVSRCWKHRWRLVKGPACSSGDTGFVVRGGWRTEIFIFIIFAINVYNRWSTWREQDLCQLRRS